MLQEVLLLNKHLYVNLAWNNIKKNKKIYLPYLLSALFTVVTFYTIAMFSESKSLAAMKGGDSLVLVMMMGTIIIGVFGIIFLFYTNGFLMKQRKKEFGLYCILGLEKRHIARVLFYESLINVGITVGGGLLAGVIISRLLFLIMLNIISFDVTLQLEYTLSPFLYTIILFLSINLLTLAKNIFQVHLVNPIELLKGSNQGEREPKASWILAVLGVGTLAYGYYMSISIQNPIAALNQFFIAVLLVIIGTHLIFTCASIYILKFLKKRKSFYYRPKNFISISGMIYRMKQNAAGLANICILSTMVIVCLVSAFSLYIGQKDIMKIQFPRNIILQVGLEDTNIDQLKQSITNTIGEFDVTVEFQGGYRGLDAFCYQNKKQVEFITEDDSYMQVEDLEKFVTVTFIPLDDYNAFTRETYTLSDSDEILLFDSHGRFDDKTLQINDAVLKVKTVLKKFDTVEPTDNVIDNQLKVITKDYDTALKLFNNLLEIDTDNTTNAEQCYYFLMDIDGTKEECIDFENQLVKDLVKDYEISYGLYHVYNEVWYVLFGGFLFIGTYFGILFLMATVLIIYYKQISEGYDDRERFTIMQKVGMSKSEVKKTIRKQILMVFTLPLIVAVCHTCFALPMLKKLFQVFSLFNTTLTNFCTLITVILYAIVYGVVYFITAKAYYKIVE